ncbi:UNVERIFIED_CONTAM: hypothetical protein GTU68_006701, partial [Idotea baltica]|nr:hypothetical protein [Idotea baltica]
LQKLGFSSCRVSIATPKTGIYNSLSDLSGKKIATSYPNTLCKYLEQNNVNAEIHVISGSVEIAPNIGLADAICDIVSSGSTLFKNGLEEREIILKSEAVLVANTKALSIKKNLIDNLNLRVQSVTKAKENKYILFNIPTGKINEVTRLLPAMKSPSIVPLGIDGWSSMHSVINQSDFWLVIDQLRNAGAEGILVSSIDNMII